MSCLVTKPTKWVCAQRRLRSAWASAQSDQSLRCLPRLIWVLAVRMKKAWILSYPLSTQQRHWSDWADAQLIWVFAGRTVTLLVLSWGGCFLFLYLWKLSCKLNLSCFCWVPTRKVFRKKIKKIPNLFRCLIRLWYFSSSVNWFFKRACAATHGWC